MNKRISIKLYSVFVLLCVSKLYAQNSSPYSYFGIGTFNNVDNARNISLGNTGIALESQDYMNSKNPAAVATISEKNVIFDVSGLMKYNTLSSNQGKDKRFNANFSNLGIALGLTKKLFLGASLQPTTTTDYRIDSTIPIEGTSSEYPITYEGSGGISNVGVNLGYRINKNWIVGAKAKNYFGTVMRKEIVTLNADVTQLEISRNEKYTGFGYGIGTQYSKYFPKNKIQLTLGAIVNFKNDLTSKGEIVYTQDQNYTSSVTESFSVKNTSIPLEKGIGINVLYKDRYRFTADYTQSDWNKVQNTITNEKYYQQNAFGFGFELLPKRKVYENFTDAIIYRFGLNYDSGYYKVKGVDINKLETTVGVGIPLQTMTLNFNYGYGMKGLQTGTAIKERYHMFNISINFKELWFLRKQIN